MLIKKKCALLTLVTTPWLFGFQTPVAVTVQPAVVKSTGSVNQTFTSTVTGTPNTAVKWSINPQLGSISQAGVYTNNAVTATGGVTVTATSVANPAKSGSATIELAVGPKPLTFTTQANGLQTLVFNGVNMNLFYGEGLLSYVTSTNVAGQSTFLTPTCSGSFTPTTVTKQCMSGSVPITVNVTYATPDPATVTATIQLTNNSPTDTINDAELSTLGVQMTQYNAALSRILYVNAMNPLSYVDFGAGQWAVWNNNPGPNSSISVTCGWTNICKNQPHVLNVAPGQTGTVSISLRFTNNPTEASITLAPEAYTEFARAYPSVVNWPDRRPIMAWFISDYTKRSATNPRGYLQQPNLDVTDIPGFTASVMGQAQNIITQMRARPVQPQGLVIWDLEGQEFIQPTTYVGDPRILSEGYAPEMNAVADQVFALFQAAGYKVGITLRPQQLQWGMQLPATCNTDPSNDYKDYYILVNAPYLQKFYACYGTAAAPAWALIPQGNGGQTFFLPTQPANVTALLMAKVAYAHARWGTTLYYVDTAVWSGGAPIPASTFTQLQQAFPDCIFMPEQSYDQTMSGSLPFSDPKNTNDPKYAPLTWRYIYPNGGLGIYLANCQGACWTTNYNNFVIGQRIGDMPIYPQPTQISPAQLGTIESMILQARSEASSITVTDTSSRASYSFQGAAATVYRYPVKMRVYFAPSAAQLGVSNNYCESGQWTGQSTCSLNLAGLVTAQIRYYDFAGNLVISETAIPR